MKYNHSQIEKKWQGRWMKDGVFEVDNESKKEKFYVLDMFPYPSGEGLHVGHPRGYIATDALAKLKMMQGFNVLHPMGWDAFGLPAENYALKTKTQPREATAKNIKNYKRQMQMLGLGYDWSREINTTDPEYYKWTQWAFAEMFKRGLVYESHEPINWCPSCKTGLANEDVEDGRCERCGTLVEKKPLRQWVIRITDYAERLLNDLDKLKDWPAETKEMQRNWIGKSEGAEINFKLQITNAKLNPKSKFQISVFTTRPDTIFGATYLVLCPEHKAVNSYQLSITNYKEVKKYIDQVKNKSDLERTDLNKEKTGIKLEGIAAINPASGEEMPIFVADYVLNNYGTGAIMAVPAHDQRDFEFAKKYNLPISPVITFVMPAQAGIQALHKKSINLDPGIRRDDIMGDVYAGEGVLVNSGKFDGLESKKAGKEIVKFVHGKMVTQYKLKDWVFSRQRYWGEPIPLIFCSECKKQTEISNIKFQMSNQIQMPNSKLEIKNLKLKIDNLGEALNPGWFVDENLPVELPNVKSYEPSGTGESPLAKIDKWVNVKCPRCGGPARRETNTMPQWAGSSWYYLAYMAGEKLKIKNYKLRINNDGKPLPNPPLGKGREELAMSDFKSDFKLWEPVDKYVGGAEHTTRHLIYARFWHKFLYDIGAVNRDEPFSDYKYVGLILAEDNRKMSKRWHNVINPDEVVETYGADALRVYEMFMGPFDQPIAWNSQGLTGARRFLDKIYNLKSQIPMTNDQTNPKFQMSNVKQNPKSKFQIPNSRFQNILHKTIKKVTEDIANFKFNTAISALMILVNDLTPGPSPTSPLTPLLTRRGEQNQERGAIDVADYETLLKLVAPFAPHLSEELWSALGHETSIFASPWPKFDSKLAFDEQIQLIVQINGKVRASILASAEIDEAAAKKLALAEANVKKWTEGKEIAKVIFIAGRLINLVIK